MISLKRLTGKEDKVFKSLCEKDDLLDSDLSKEKFQGEAIPNDVEIDEEKRFDSKFSLGSYLYEKLKDISMDEKVWHYLTIIYHKQLLRSGKIGETGRFYIDVQKPRIHLLKVVFDLYRFYHEDPELIRFLLLGPVNQSSKLFVRVVESPEMMKNREFISVSNTLFYDAEKGNNKTGSGEAIARLIALFHQYARTYDLHSMPADKILNDLISKHKEFDKFRGHNT